MKKQLLLALLLLSTFASHAQTTILSEGFNVTTRTAAPPTGWSLVNTIGSNDGGCGIYTNTWEQVPSLGFNCNGSTPIPPTHSGSGMAGYNAWDMSSGSKSELVTPALNFSGLGTTTLNVWIWDSVSVYINPFGSNYVNVQYDSLSIFVNTSPTSSGGTRLYLGTPSYHVGGTGWTLFSFSIPTSYTGTTNYIIFRAASLYGNDMFFDDVEVIRNPPTPCSGTPISPTISTAATTTAAPLCSGSSKTINATDPNYPTVGGLTYQWEYSSSSTGPWASVTSGTGANTLSYNTGSLTASTYYRMSITCTASGVTVYSGAYFVPVGAPQPSTITGSASFCPGDPSTYSVTNVSGTTYTWTLPVGWSGTSTTNSITVTPSATAGSISVIATSSCGSSIAQTKTVSAGSAPAAPTAITGSSSVCANSSQTYSIAAVTGATSYSWTLPAGWVITSTASGGQTITVTTGTTSGNVTAIAQNGCGSNSKSLAVTTITTLANPGTVTQTPSGNTCVGALYTYSVNPVAGATSYQWTLPSGWSSGPTTGTSIQAFAGTTGGNVSLTAYSSCSTSPTATYSATVTPSVTPRDSVISSSTPICQNAPITFTALPTNAGSSPSYIWKKNGVTVLGTGNTYLDNKLVTGDVITAQLLSSATCRTADTVSASLTVTVTPSPQTGISINTTPTITVCDSTTVNFTTNISGGGSSPSYQWFINGSAIGATGPTFSTAGLKNNDTVTVSLTSSAVCAPLQPVLSNKVGIKVNPNVIPSISISASTTTAIPGMPITFTAVQSGGGATPVYQWILNGVDIPNETGTSYTTSSLKPTDHVSVRMLSYDPCAKPAVVMSNEIVLDNGTTGIAGVSTWEGRISLYPNPTGGHFTIAAAWTTAHAGKRISVDVLNVIGQSVYHTDVAPDKAQWNYDVQLNENTPNGHYILRIQSVDGMRAALPFMLNR